MARAKPALEPIFRIWVIHCRSASELSTAFGLYNTMCAVGAVISPGLTGWTRDVTGSFVAGAYLCAVVALVGALITLPIRSRAPVSA